MEMGIAAGTFQTVERKDRALMGEGSKGKTLIDTDIT